jgi:hypothetical protein
MFRSAWLRHRAIFVMVCALLLKAAVPMLASGAALAQGKSVAEVCTVYGVATLSAQAAQHAHHMHHPHGEAGGGDHSQHAASHGGDHCALAGLAALAAADEPARLVLPPVHRRHDPPVFSGLRETPDTCALWVARLKQGPPPAA